MRGGVGGKRKKYPCVILWYASFPNPVLKVLKATDELRSEYKKAKADRELVRKASSLADMKVCRISFHGQSNGK